MKWRIAPNLDLDIVKNTKCLLLGSGTLGSYVARNLLVRLALSRARACTYQSLTADPSTLGLGGQENHVGRQRTGFLFESGEAATLRFQRLS